MAGLKNSFVKLFTKDDASLEQELIALISQASEDECEIIQEGFDIVFPESADENTDGGIPNPPPLPPLPKEQKAIQYIKKINDTSAMHQEGRVEDSLKPKKPANHDHRQAFEQELAKKLANRFKLNMEMEPTCSESLQTSVIPVLLSKNNKQSTVPNKTTKPAVPHPVTRPMLEPTNIKEITKLLQNNWEKEKQDLSVMLKESQQNQEQQQIANNLQLKGVLTTMLSLLEKIHKRVSVKNSPPTLFCESTQTTGEGNSLIRITKNESSLEEGLSQNNASGSERADRQVSVSSSLSDDTSYLSSSEDEDTGVLDDEFFQPHSTPSVMSKDEFITALASSEPETSAQIMKTVHGNMQENKKSVLDELLKVVKTIQPYNEVDENKSTHEASRYGEYEDTDGFFSKKSKKKSSKHQSERQKVKLEDIDPEIIAHIISEVQKNNHIKSIKPVVTEAPLTVATPTKKHTFNGFPDDFQSELMLVAKQFRKRMDSTNEEGVSSSSAVAKAWKQDKEHVQKITEHTTTGSHADQTDSGPIEGIFSNTKQAWRQVLVTIIVRMFEDEIQ